VEAPRRILNLVPEVLARRALSVMRPAHGPECSLAQDTRIAAVRERRSSRAEELIPTAGPMTAIAPGACVVM
jgi:hypothetical protein